MKKLLSTSLIIALLVGTLVYLGLNPSNYQIPKAEAAFSFDRAANTGVASATNTKVTITAVKGEFLVGSYEITGNGTACATRLGNPTVSDTLGNTWIFVRGNTWTSSGTFDCLVMAYAFISSNTASDVITFSDVNAYSIAQSATVEEFIGSVQSTASLLDTFGFASGTASPFTSSSFTTTNAADVIVCGAGNYYQNGFTASTIGTNTATIPANGINGSNGTSGGNSAEEYFIATTTQTSITGKINIAGASVAGGIICGAFFPVTVTSYTCTPGSGYSYCLPIVIDHTKVSAINGTALNSFPIEASSTIPQLATVTNGGHVQNLTTESGSSFTGQVPADLQFSTSSTFSAYLPGWEDESYASTTGNIDAWLNVGNSISTSTDTVIYAEYGNASVTTWQGNVNGTWNSNYAGVWHFPNGSTLNANDSTINANNGTLHNTPTATSGLIDGGVNYVGSSSQSVNMADAVSLKPANLTISTWVNPTTTGDAQTFISYGKDTGNAYVLGFIVNSGFLTFCSYNGSWICAQTAASNATANAWNYIVGTDDGTNFNIYVNGAFKASTTATTLTYNSTHGLYFGAYDNSSNYLTGKQDEVHISSIGESADWINTEYNNQSTPDKANYGSIGFYSIQTEQTGGGGGTTTSTVANITILPTGDINIKQSGSLKITNNQ